MRQSPRPAPLKAVIDKLIKAFVAALNAPETKTRFGHLPSEPVPTPPKPFDSAGERANYKTLGKATGATVDGPNTVEFLGKNSC